jgi:methylmalonyl-CoA/ethylmalonyl-CoA epimerase
MTVLKCLHHINFLVADIDAAVDAYQGALGVGPFEFEDLPERGVSTARLLIGGVWIVLVSPYDDESDAGCYLRDHGEGFFLMSFGVDDLDRALVDLARRGTVPANRQARAGILDWRVADLDTENTLGVRLHLTQVQ